MNQISRNIVLPPESLLGTHEPWEVRAWRHAESELHARATAGDVKGLAVFYGLPVPVVREAVRRSDTPGSAREQLGDDWVAHPEARATLHRSADGVVYVRPPFHSDVIRDVLLEWRQSRPELSPFVSRDLFTLVQLLTAETHALGNSSILVVGDTGTGKEVIAGIVHALSRRNGNMVRLNCTAVADTLFASELFGHVKGAFTGALSAKDGYVAAAANGTLFLDEIGDLAPEHQPRLLRLLREREYFRVGSHELQRSTARVIAATNADVEDDAAAGYFRADLFQRLGGCRLQLRPLRRRKDDVPLLLRHFAGKNEHSADFSAAALSVLEAYSWPGNVAELRACVEHATTQARGRAIEIVDLPDHIVDQAYPRRGTARGVFVSAEFLSRARGDDASGAATDQLLAEVLGRELEDPPRVGGDAELDALVRTTIGATLAFAAFQRGRAFETRDLDDRMAVVRKAGLLAEVQTVAQDLGHDRLAELATSQLHDVLKTDDEVPWLGVAVKVIATVLASDDPEEREEIVALVARLKESAPLLAGLIGRLAEASTTTSASASENGTSTSHEEVSTVPWTAPARRPQIVRALEDAEGVQAEAARSLGLADRYFRSLVKRHDLTETVARLRNARGERGPQ